MQLHERGRLPGLTGNTRTHLLEMKKLHLRAKIKVIVQCSGIAGDAIKQMGEDGLLTPAAVVQLRCLRHKLSLKGGPGCRGKLTVSTHLVNALCLMARVRDMAEEML